MADGLKYKRKNPFVILSHNFIKWGMLNWNEKDIYIILLMYADSEQKCFPSINTLCKVSGKSNKTVIRALKGLEEKHLLKKETRITKNGQSSNLYTLYDFESVWEAGNIEQVSEIVNTETKRKHLFELARELNYIVTKEKEPTSVPTKVTDVSTQINNSQQQDTIPVPKSQELQKQERYALDEIKQLFEYDIMLQDNLCLQKDIDSVMDILYNAMNTTKSTIRIGREDKPSMIVIGKLMKLNKESIVYAINKFTEQTERIRNTTAYMLTILYNTPEQFNLDMQNQIQHNVNNWNNKDVEYQRYNYNELEKQLLG